MPRPKLCSGETSPDALKSIQRRWEVERLRQQGLSDENIANQLGISTYTVHTDLKANRELWLSRVHAQRDGWIAEQLQSLDLIQQLAMEEFSRSRQTAVEKVNEETTGAKGLTTKKKDRKRNRIGDSRFLKVAIDCIEQRREMLGLDLPEQTADDLERESSEPMVIEVTTRDAARIVMGSTDGRVAVRITDSTTVAPSADPMTVEACPVAPSHRQAPKDVDDLPTY